jgi:peptide/nickel transport system ATP-binding protein
MSRPPLLDVAGLVREYVLPRPHPFAAAPRLRVLHGIDLMVQAGEGVGIVGESGSGKSTLARSVLALERPQGGSVRLNGLDLFALPPRVLRSARRHVQAVFQDPYGSLDPRHSIGRIVAEPIAALEPHVARAERRDRVASILNDVGLPGAAQKYPHEFSGGQRQRIAIARALVTRPSLVVADEPVSALDVSVQAQVLTLMADLRARLGLAWLFISHDLGVVRSITDRVAVLYRGRVVEEGPTAAVFAVPRHPYTAALVAAVPRIGHRRAPAVAVADRPAAAAGCPYAGPCPRAAARCRTDPPPLAGKGGRKVACHFPADAP